MPAFLLGLLKYIPLVGGLFEKWTENQSRAAEIRAEKELVEAKAFARGRISPKYLLKYVIVFIFALLALGLLGHSFFRTQFPLSPMGDMRELINMGLNILDSVGW